MNYELAKKLKEAGFPVKKVRVEILDQTEFLHPTLSELIEACEDRFKALRRQHNPDLPSERSTWWKAESNAMEQSTQAYAGADEVQPINRKGSTPEEAVANLWLKLNL